MQAQPRRSDDLKTMDLLIMLFSREPKRVRHSFSPVHGVLCNASGQDVDNLQAMYNGSEMARAYRTLPYPQSRPSEVGFGSMEMPRGPTRVMYDSYYVL